MSLTPEEAAARLVVVERAIVNLAILVETLRQDLVPPVELHNDLC